MLRCAGLAVALLATTWNAEPAAAVPISGPDTVHAVSAARLRLALNPQPEPPNKNKKLKAGKGGDSAPKAPRTTPPSTKY
jgi:hypothetical protein